MSHVERDPNRRFITCPAILAEAARSTDVVGLRGASGVPAGHLPDGC